MTEAVSISTLSGQDQFKAYIASDIETRRKTLELELPPEMDEETRKIIRNFALLN